MDPLITNLGIPTGMAGWDLLQNATPSSFPQLTNDPVVKQQIAYFEQNAPKATTAQALLSNPQLQDFVLTAYGMQSESGFTSFMEKVLNSDTSQSNSFAASLSNSQFLQIAKDFNYGGSGSAATSSSATVAIGGLAPGGNLGTFSGTFAGITLSNVDVSGDTNLQDLASTLQAAFRTADGSSTSITVTANGNSLNFTDAAGRGTAQGFSWTLNPANTTGAPVVAAPTSLVTGNAASGGSTSTSWGAAATASSATVNVGGLSAQGNFGTFSGTFAGITLSNVDVSGATSLQSLAATLQAAYQSADSGSSNITVAATATGLSFSDAAGRGTAQNFSWTLNPANTTGAPVASAPGSLVTGTPAASSSGGPSVTNPAFIQYIVQKYTEQQLQVVVGDQSNTLREAMYAQQTLPTITNWYSVIASPPLADVIQTVLNLPSSFGQLNVDTQAQILASKMNLSDFQNPTKLSAMLNQFVAISSAASSTGTTSTSPALQLLTAATSTTPIALTLPTTADDSMSGDSAAALLLST
jgi:hypothetical protein